MYRIRNAAEKAGVSSEVLRAWERRYGLVAPERNESGYRLYSDEDVVLIRGAKRLVDDGLSIADVARLPRAQLLEAGAAGTRKKSSFEPVFEAGTASGPWLPQALLSVADFDGEALEKILFRASNMGAMNGQQTCEQVLLPLLFAIGKAWEQGTLPVAAEHFGSGWVRGKLLRLLDSENRARRNEPAVLCACGPGEEHEGGLLAYAVKSAAQGKRIIYLGANTPLQETIAAARAQRVQEVALSFTQRIDEDAMQSLAQAVLGPKEAGHPLIIVAGGRGAWARQDELRRIGVQVPAEELPLS